MKNEKIFTGKVVNIELEQGSMETTQKVTFAVHKNYYNGDKTIIIKNEASTNGMNCGYNYEIGKYFLSRPDLVITILHLQWETSLILVLIRKLLF